jgi:hypothetical protein
METTKRHFEYIIYYENEIAKEQQKKKPNTGYIIACERTIIHSRERIGVLRNLQ